MHWKGKPDGSWVDQEGWMVSFPSVRLVSRINARWPRQQLGHGQAFALGLPHRPFSGWISLCLGQKKRTMPQARGLKRKLWNKVDECAP